MSEVYRIGVAIMLTDGMGPVLSRLSHQLLGIHKSAKDIEGSFNKWRVALVGAAGVMAGTGILKGIAKVAEHGEEILDQQDKLIRAGRTHAEVAKITAEAYGQITKAVPTATAADVLRVANELTLVKGNFAEAAEAASSALKIEALIGNATGRPAEGQGYSMWRAIEEKGVTLDKALTDKTLGLMLQGTITSGGKVTGADWFTFARRAGVSWRTLDTDALGVIPTLIQSLGASTAGTSYMSAYQTVQGAHVLWHQQFDAMRQLGILDMSRVKAAKAGRYQILPGGIRGSLEYGGNLYEWERNVLHPAYERLHLTPAQIRAFEAKMFPNRNTMRMMDMFEFSDQQIVKDVALQKQALPLDPAYANFVQNNPMGVKEAFGQQYNSMMSAIGAPLMQAALPVMRGITDMFNKIGQFANAHPETIKIIGEGLAALGVALVGAGAAAIVAAIGVGGWLVGGIAALGAVLMMVPWKDAWTSLGNVISWVADKVTAAANAIKAVIPGLGGPSGAAGIKANPYTGMPAMPHGPLGPAPSGLGKQGYNAVPPASGGTRLASAGAIYMDGKKVGEIVTAHQARAANGPLQGSALYDGTATFVPADYSYARG